MFDIFAHRKSMRRCRKQQCIFFLFLKIITKKYIFITIVPIYILDQLIRCLERNYKKTLYVNADRLQSFQWMLENGEPIRDASVYAGLSGNLGNVYRIVRHVIRKEGFSYLPPFKAALMSLGIPYRVFALLAEAARKEQEYDYIVIDADSVFDEEKAALMQLADKILIVTKQTEYAVKATNELIQNVNRCAAVGSSNAFSSSFLKSLQRNIYLSLLFRFTFWI